MHTVSWANYFCRDRQWYESLKPLRFATLKKTLLHGSHFTYLKYLEWISVFLNNSHCTKVGEKKLNTNKMAVSSPRIAAKSVEVPGSGLTCHWFESWSTRYFLSVTWRLPSTAWFRSLIMKIKITSVVYKPSNGVVGLGNTLLRTWVLPRSPCQLLTFLKKSVKKTVKLRHSAKWLRTGTSQAVATSALL